MFFPQKGTLTDAGDGGGGRGGTNHNKTLQKTFCSYMFSYENYSHFWSFFKNVKQKLKNRFIYTEIITESETGITNDNL